MSSYSRDNFPGFTIRKPGQTVINGLRSSARATPRPRKRTSGPKRVSFSNRTPTYSRRKTRKSKKTSPRTNLIKIGAKILKKNRHRLSRIKNPYIRDLGELTLVLGPFISAALIYAIATRKKNSDD